MKEGMIPGLLVIIATYMYNLYFCFHFKHPDYSVVTLIKSSVISRIIIKNKIPYIQYTIPLKRDNLRFRTLETVLTDDINSRYFIKS